jgi:hypothetical protein
MARPGGSASDRRGRGTLVHADVPATPRARTPLYLTAGRLSQGFIRDKRPGIMRRRARRNDHAGDAKLDGRQIPTLDSLFRSGEPEWLLSIGRHALRRGPIKPSHRVSFEPKRRGPR